MQTRLRDGRTIDLGYDALGRLTSKSAPGTAFFEHASTYAYDNLGRLTSAEYPGYLGVGFAYDALGRKTAEASSAFGTTRSQCDLAGRRTRLTWRDGFAVDYAYLVTGEMASIAEATGAMLATFAYDRGRRTLLTRGNGTVTTYAYDPGSRLQTLRHDLGGTAYDLSSTFGYNPASQIVSNDRSNDAYAIAGAAAVQTDSSVDGLNQLLAIGGRAVTHDARGNLASDGARAYGYTSENRLATVSGQSSTNLAYDPLGRLFHISSSGTDLRYDGSDVIEETEAYTSAIRRRYVHGPGPSTGSGQGDEPIVAYDGGGARRYLHADERGSIVATSDRSGNPLHIARYDEYGATPDCVTEVRRGKKIDVYHLVKNTPKVTGFLGSMGKPQPITENEANRILNTKDEQATAAPKAKISVDYEIGDSVKVLDGPFASFNGLVEELDFDRSRVKVSVSIFGRATPVELEFEQVELAK